MTGLTQKFQQPPFEVVDIVYHGIEGDRHSACQNDGWSIVAVGALKQEFLLAIVPKGGDDAHKTRQAAREFFGLAPAAPAPAATAT